MTTPKTKDPELIAAEIDREKRCFTYCGPELCNCCARNAFGTLSFIEPALPVLATMCRKAALPQGGAKADEMHAEVRRILQDKSHDR